MQESMSLKYEPAWQMINLLHFGRAGGNQGARLWFVVYGLWLVAWGLWFRDWGLGVVVQGLGFRAEGLEFEVLGLGGGFRVKG